MSLDIVMADPKAFDGKTREEGPLGGAESTFCDLAESLAARGHRVRAFTEGARRIAHAGVVWRPIADGVPDRCDLLIASRGSKMIGLVPRATRRLFWLHNPAQYISKPKFVAPLLRWRPTIVVIGSYHATTVPGWVPKRKIVTIPHGVAQNFRRGTPAVEAPGPRAIMTSNPERGLLWLVETWIAKVQPRVPNAELRVFSGAATYGGRHAEAMNELIDRAKKVAGDSVQFHAPVPQAQLVRELEQARLMPYRGDVGETYCQAVAEAQAMGVPVVTKPIGSLPERVQDGVTGFVRADDDAFADACVDLLTDDALWQRQHTSAVESGGGWSWDAAAQAFETLAGETRSGGAPNGRDGPRT